MGKGVFLFSYGTLRQRDVQLATFGRELAGKPDTLPGFSISMVAITDSDVVATSGLSEHPIVRRTGDPSDQISGTVFEITPEELAHADKYEADDYKRVEVELGSGRRAYVYVDAHSD